MIPLMGIQLPRVIFGTTCLGNLFVAPSDGEKRELMHQWFRQMSVPVAIDTAGKYGAGLALQVIGRELAAAGIAPSDVIISNKLGWRRVPLRGSEPTFEPGVWVGLEHDAVQDISYDGILRCWQEGCEFLGDYPAQLLSVHDPDEYLAAASDPSDRRRRLDHIVSAHQALVELRYQGLATAIGVGAKEWRIIRELDRLCPYDWVMLANSLTIMSHPPELIEFIQSLAERRITIINSALLHGGFLSGGSFLDYRRVDPDDPEDAKRMAWRSRFHEICEAHGASPYAVAVAYGLSHPAVSSVALSTSRPDRVQEMVSAAMTPLDDDLLRTLEDAGLI